MGNAARYNLRTMNRTQLISLIAVGLIAALVLFLSLRERQPPVLPADADHLRFIDAETCMACHDLDAAKNHPLRRECLDCHGRG